MKSTDLDYQNKYKEKIMITRLLHSFRLLNNCKQSTTFKLNTQ